MCVETPGDLARLGDAELIDVVSGVEADRRRLHAAESDVLAVVWSRIEAGGGRRGDLKALLVAEHGVSAAGALRREDVASQWASMPLTAEALRDGEVSFDHVVAMARAAREHPDRFAAEEAQLLDEARRRTAGGFAIVVDRWVKTNDPDGGDDRAARARRRARVDRFDAGPEMFGVRCEFANLEGQQVWAAIVAEARRLWRGDHPLFDDAGFDPGRDIPSAARYRAAALVKLACGDPAVRRGGGAQVIVTATVDDVAAGRGGEFLDGTQVSAGEMGHLLCTSPIAGLVFSARGEVLWHGRNKRLATAAQRRAIKVRDRHCTVGTCTVRADECDVHHLDPYATGGDTNIDEMALACPRCHLDKIHRRGWTHTGTPGHDLTWHPPVLVPTRAPPGTPPTPAVAGRAPPHAA